MFQNYITSTKYPNESIADAYLVLQNHPIMAQAADHLFRENIEHSSLRLA